jgi:hypothetical protein
MADSTFVELQLRNLFAAWDAVLIASCAEMSSLNRNVHHLTSMLRDGSLRAAQDRREFPLHQQVRATRPGE